MISYSNQDILMELQKSGDQFAELFIQKEARFIPLPQSGDYDKMEAERYAAQVNDVITVAHHNTTTKVWKFRSFVLMV